MARPIRRKFEAHSSTIQREFEANWDATPVVAADSLFLDRLLGNQWLPFVCSIGAYAAEVCVQPLTGRVSRQSARETFSANDRANRLLRITLTTSYLRIPPVYPRLWHTACMV